MAKPFLTFYQDFAKAYPVQETSDGVLKFSLPADLWESWLAERQEGCRWIIDKRQKEGDKGFSPQYERRERWKCNHGGAYKDRRDVNISPRKTRIRNPSIKEGCLASIVLIKLKNSTRVAVTWRTKHTGHDPASMADWRSSSLLSYAKIWIRDRVNEGLDWKSIHDLLRIEPSVLEALDKTSTQLPQALRIGRMDVYNVLRKQLIATSQKSPDLDSSLSMWIKSITESGGWGYCDGSNIAFATKWQRTHWNSTTLCLDATHNTCKDGFLLYSVVVRSKMTGKGVPIAFLLTQDAASAPITDFLNRLALKPTHFMIDCSFTEAHAIQNAYPTATILYCDWHVLKSISKNVQIHIKEDKAGRKTKTELHTMAMQDFQKLMKLDNQSLYRKTYLDLINKWHVLGFESWSNYISRTWHPHHERWVQAWRIAAHDGINTNNYIESWHGTLKREYLGTLRRQRPDYLVHLLVDKIVPDFQLEDKQCELGLLSWTYNQAEKEAKRKADAASLGLVNGNTVHSFTTDAIYNISAGCCSCLAPNPCKHIFLKERFDLQIKADEPNADLIMSDVDTTYGQPEIAQMQIISTFDAIAEEKAHLIESIQKGVERLLKLSQQLTSKAGRQQLSDLEARLVSYNHCVGDVVFNRSPSATQS